MKTLIMGLIVSLLPWNFAMAAEQTIDMTTASSAEVSSNQAVKLKRKVAIARFTNETQSGTSFLVNNSGDRIGKQASDILSSRLAETGYFLMFERTDTDKISTEKILAGLKDAGVSVDYLIIGSVSEFGRSTESDTGVFSRSKVQKAYAKVNVRLIEVSTGRIIHSEEGAGEALTQTKKTMGVGSSAGFDQSLTDKAISSAISQLTSNLVENMTSKPWRSYLLAEQEGSYILAGGNSQGLKQGINLRVFSNGITIKNPQTGAMITLPGKEVATLAVIDTFGEDEFNEISYTSLISGSIGSDLTKYYVVE
jgi:curli biogenesis system outer membrane secretion channel CsgG|tara:strand:- start:1711 stop:2637 length:927 start_codon:yes stop_codon:yes gene_type:complete